MFHCLCFLFSLTLFAHLCASQKFELGTLQVHPPSHDTKDTIEICNIHLDEDNSIFAVNIESINAQEIIPFENYCLSFKPPQGREFHCFNYFEGNGNMPLQGTLSLSFKVNTTLIDSITFTPRKTGNLIVKIVPSLGLGDPRPKLYTNDNKKKQLMEAQIIDEIRKKDEENKKAEILISTPKLDAIDENDDDKNNGEFQEVIHPKHQDADKKTFIERNWKYIVLPSIVFIIIGNMILGD